MHEYIDRKDTCRYLHNTLARYKQEIVHVTADQFLRGAGIHDILVSPFGAKKGIPLKCTDPDFSTHMPELGYVNVDKDAYYAMKKPRRVQRAGLCMELITFKGGRVPNDGSYVIFLEPGFKMLKDEYPTFLQAEAVVAWDNHRGMAFSKNLAIRMSNRFNKHIEYKGEIACIWNPIGDFWYIPQPRKDTSYIKLILGRYNIPIR